MTSDNSNKSESISADEAREQMIARFEKAKAENYEFGLIAERMFVWLIKYKQGNTIPEEFWDLYQQLSDSVSHDPTGKMEFSESELSVMVLLNHVMKKAGLVITLTDKDTINTKLEFAMNNLFNQHSLNTTIYKAFLYAAFFPPISSKIGQDTDIFFL
ncbi:MAG: hypothetical protein QXX08_10315 [Candidatus Bathyarchaeia archaeon]